MKRHRFIALAGTLSLAACAAQTQLAASQDFGKAQVVFMGLQQAALACISAGVGVCVANKDAIIAANDKGVVAEQAGVAAEQAHAMGAVGQATVDLGAAITALGALGVK